MGHAVRPGAGRIVERLMLQLPARRRNPAQRVSRSYTVPSPYGGWNARDNIAAMAETDAVILDNWYPSETSVAIRKGYAQHATGLPDVVETLMVYASPTAEEMYAASDGDIYDVSASGAVGAAEVSSLTNDRWQWVNMGTSGGHFLLAVNGDDDMRKYDGSAWGVINSGSSPAITGVDTADCIGINIFKRRVFLIEKNTLSFWYLPVDSIGGAAAEFSLSALVKKGGYLMAMGTWTRDGGEGLDDLAVFLTSEGEAIIYQGTDPGSATDWALVGRFEIGAPIGRRCMVQLGSELFVITQNGFIPISRALAAAQTNSRVAFSDKIKNAFDMASRDYGANFGWQGVFYPKGGWLFVNIPLAENQTAHQYVANSTTGSWCRFRNMNANCWAVFGGNLYFGGADAVYQADIGLDDNGTDIETDVQQAYTFLGSPGSVKKMNMLRPVLKADGALSVGIAVNVDFEDAAPDSTPSFSAPDGAVWNEAAWNVEDWGAGGNIQKQWRSVGKIGTAGAIRMSSATQNISLEWFATTWIWETGGYL